MKHVQFKSIEITNFLSIGKTQRVDFADGITAIFGVNHDKANDSNGVGKSTVLSAISFALFGDPIKNVKRDEVVNRIANGKCVVALDFDVDENGTVTEYKVERGVKPSFCHLYKDGKDISLSGMPETTKFICDVIGTSAVMFKNTCLMTLEDNVPFARQKAAEKREFIEGVFDLGFIKEMAKMAKAESDKYVAENTEATTRIDEIKKQIESFEKGMAEFDENTKNNIVEKLEKIKELQERKAAAEKKLMQFDESELTEATEEFKGIQKDLDRLSAERESLLLDKSNIIKEGTELKARIASAKSRNEENRKFYDKIVAQAKEYGIDDFLKFIEDNDADNLSDKISSSEKKVSAIDEAVSSEKAVIAQNNRNINSMMKFGNICLECGRPFSDSDINERNAKIQKLRNENDEKLKRIRLLESKKVEIKALIDVTREKLSHLGKIEMMYDQYSSYKDIDTTEDEKKIVALREKVVDNAEKMKDNDTAQSFKKADMEIATERVSKLREAKAAIMSVEAEIDSLTDIIETFTKEVKAMKDAGNPFKPRLDEAKATIEEWGKKKDDTEHMCSVYRSVREVLSDDGFRSYIVKQYISALNNQINEYLAGLDAPVHLEFDEYLEDKIIDQLTGAVCSYDSLSGGEKRRVDIACLLAFSDLRRMRGDVLFSHSFYDEILDSALSPGACSKLMGILNKRYVEDKENSIIITHKQEMQDDPNISHKILVEKIGGVSKLSYE